MFSGVLDCVGHLIFCVFLFCLHVRVWQMQISCWLTLVQSLLIMCCPCKHKQWSKVSKVSYSQRVWSHAVDTCSETRVSDSLTVKTPYKTVTYFSPETWAVACCCLDIYWRQTRLNWNKSTSQLSLSFINIKNSVNVGFIQFLYTYWVKNTPVSL